MDFVGEGFDCAVRVGYLSDFNLIARRIGPIHGKLVASPDYIKKHGAPETPDELLTHQALMQGTETWQFIDGDKTVSVHPQGRFKADNGTALAAAAVAGLGIAALPDCLTENSLGFRRPGSGDDALSASPKPAYLSSGRRDSTPREKFESSPNC